MTRKPVERRFLAAAIRGDTFAQCRLGYLYLRCKGDSQRLRRGFNWSVRAAEAGSLDALFNVALCYDFGWGVRRNPREARRAYLFLAKCGDAPAQCNLGVLYEDGEGGRADYRKARKWFLAAARRGDDKGQCHLARCYELGIGGRKCIPLAKKWYSRASAQGHTCAQKRLDRLLAQQNAKRTHASAGRRKTKTMATR
jgi:TPR repeat protein